jgi:hypothetical protein
MSEHVSREALNRLQAAVATLVVGIAKLEADVTNLNRYSPHSPSPSTSPSSSPSHSPSTSPSSSPSHSPSSSPSAS